MKCLVAASMLLLLPMLVGCEASPPTESDGRQAMEKRILKESENRLKLLSFHKTNSQAAEPRHGVRRYKIWYECEVEVAEDFYWEENSFIRESFSTSEHNPNVKKGQRLKISGFMWFEMTDNGWMYTNLG